MNSVALFPVLACVRHAIQIRVQFDEQWNERHLRSKTCDYVHDAWINEGNGPKQVVKLHKI